jgi:type VI secretion system secreted protein Hcp
MATIFLKWPGITGSATAEGYKDWIDCSSMNYTIDRTIKQGVGLATNREAAHPVISKISLSKAVDLASTRLFNHSVTGDKGTGKPTAGPVEIRLCSADDLGKMREWGIMKLTNVTISKYKLAGEADGAPKEELELAWTKIEYEFKKYGKDNKASGKNGFEYNLATNVAAVKS